MHRDAQVLLGGLSQWTVGLLATFLAVACIIAADVGAFVVGKAVGRTPLSEISPKKTVEGAAGGLLCRWAPMSALMGSPTQHPTHSLDAKPALLPPLHRGCKHACAEHAAPVKSTRPIVYGNPVLLSLW